MPEKSHKTFYRQTLEWLLMLLLAVAVVVFVLQFFVGFGRVKNFGMANSLFTGDVVFINKSKVGARGPITPIGIPYTHYYSDAIELPYQRYFKNDSLEHGELLAFNSPLADSLPLDRRDIWFGRAVGLPGDTIKIHYGRLYRNGLYAARDSLVLHSYSISVSDSLAIPLLFKKYRILFSSPTREENEWIISASRRTSKLLAADSTVLKIDGILFNETGDSLYPYPGYQDFSLDQYGPVVLPRKGDTLWFNTVEGRYFAPLLRKYQKLQIEHRNDSTFVDSTYQNYIVNRYDYYFLLGDNRHHSIDSRHFGPVPETHIIGSVAGFLYKSEPTQILVDEE